MYCLRAHVPLYPGIDPAMAPKPEFSIRESLYPLLIKAMISLYSTAIGWDLVRLACVRTACGVDPVDCPQRGQFAHNCACNYACERSGSWLTPLSPRSSYTRGAGPQILAAGAAAAAARLPSRDDACTETRSRHHGREPASQYHYSYCHYYSYYCCNGCRRPFSRRYRCHQPGRAPRER